MRVKPGGNYLGSMYVKVPYHKQDGRSREKGTASLAGMGKSKYASLETNDISRVRRSDGPVRKTRSKRNHVSLAGEKIAALAWDFPHVNSFARRRHFPKIRRGEASLPSQKGKNGIAY
ncbi:hypothetical protein Tco_0424699 [Tanacetum coccineum]